MKKIVIITILLGAVLTASADDYAYLNIVRSDGSAITLPASGVTLTFEDGYLVTGDEKILLSELSVMRFSNEAIGTAIDQLEGGNEAFSLSEADAVFDLSGRQMPKDFQLPKGVYIVKKGNTVKKSQVR